MSKAEAVTDSKRSLPVVYSCSGCSSAAQMANHTAVRLDRTAQAEMSCIAGVGGDVPSLVKIAKSGRPILAIDGCPLRCVERSLARHGVIPAAHLILTNLGIKKRFHQRFDENEAVVVYRRAVAALRSIETPPPAEHVSSVPAVQTGRNDIGRRDENSEGVPVLTADTSLIDGIMRDESLLDRIIALDGRFGKFRKVLNDERVAANVNLKDVAHMLDVEVRALLAFANGQAPMEMPGKPSELPVSGSIDASATARILDVRPLFERGIEPLMTILEAASALEGDAALIVEAPFHPLPLRRLLGGRGFESRAARLSSEHWQVAFRHEPPGTASRDAAR
ncbi:putative zinc-binding protein [Bradyrhizobium canariense]|uniref:Uncharacterized protein, contains metal-binding DGC domain n=1 Tax=Bradyrhizobium canariense TaxID=255045 RepID=A0A1H2BFM5_9BRAD|nr:putative zinc-binding protein [Bradyrhizobium canariense]SDT57041.1 Uncharacterized protein, contains metal-binding DGC domain [Bradyrhizobium canariense]